MPHITLHVPVCLVVYVEMNQKFDEMLKRIDDAVKEAINNLRAQVSQSPVVDGN